MTLHPLPSSIKTKKSDQRLDPRLRICWLRKDIVCNDESVPRDKSIRGSGTRTGGTLGRLEPGKVMHGRGDGCEAQARVEFQSSRFQR